MVQATQEWLNSTYGQASWFEPIPADRLGKTGWTTMFALTRALQYELGIDIALISDSFGPTTTERFTVNVGVISAATKPNIIRILQGALWCKGYTGGPLDGTYSPLTQSGVSAACEDMGFDTLHEVDARVMKALLTMDAYVVVLGGSEAIREVQQWMNRTYRDHANYVIIPCDGHYSRYVQKMLVYAIQWALNVSGANGNYGPGTRTAVRTNGTVQQGSSGRLTQLFIAALYFNRYNPGGFGNTFTAAVASEVRRMQAFERLPVTGKGDYDTWSSLLVSNGNPNRPVTAIDTRFWITPEIAADLKANGYQIVGRYLANSNVANPLDKKLRPGEVQTIINAGLALFPIWQMSGTSADHFSGTQAIFDADGAIAAAESFEIPHGSIIYFAVDFDALDQDISYYILPYFQALIARVRNAGTPYLVGVYGSRNVCSRVSQEAGAVSSFVSGMSTGFSGNLGFTLPTNWAFNQILETNLVLNGKNYYQGTEVVAVDNDVVSGWDQGVRSLVAASEPSAAFISYVEKIWEKAIAYVNEYGHDVRLQSLAYMRYPTYDSLNWNATAGQLYPQMQELGDQVQPQVWHYTSAKFGINIGREHFAATAGAVYFNDPAFKTEANTADLAGAFGDLLSLIPKWRGDPAGASLKDFVLEQVGGFAGSFSMEDLIQDVDGYLVGMRARQGATIPQAVEAVISAPTSRDNFQEFFQSRFNGSHATLQAAVKYSAQSDAIEFRLLRAGEDNADGASGAPLSDSLAQELAEGFDEAFSRYI